MHAARWWGQWLLTVLVGYGVVPAAIGLWPWHSDALPPGCGVPIDWCISDRDWMRFLLLAWAYIAPAVLVCTLAILVLLYRASGREGASATSWRVIFWAVRLTVLLGPAALGLYSLSS